MPGAVEAVEDVAPVVSGGVLLEAMLPLRDVLLVLGAPASAWLGYCVDGLLELAAGVEVGEVLAAVLPWWALLPGVAELECCDQVVLLPGVDEGLVFATLALLVLLISVFVAVEVED